MKLQNLTVIFIIIILPIILVLSAYVGYEIKTINKQNVYSTGLISATHDAIFSFEMNTKNDNYSNNAEIKRENIKAAVKTFENSLSTACNLGLYNNEAIEEYIPAIVFGLYDGFYMYAPSELIKEDGTKEYKHNLRNYVYYSEEIKDESNRIDIVIRYSLDNYVAVTGTIDGIYVTKAGYLTNLDDFTGKTSEHKYYGTKFKNIDISDKDAIEYYKESYEFTFWLLKDVKLGDVKDYLNISSTNDPEDENSAFVQHKRKIMKEKIEGILNSSITAYAKKTGNNYKMPKFSEEDWEKIYTNISVISFVQGMNLGLKNYNNYCILNSTNNQEYVNSNLMYFTDGNGEYHDIRCDKLIDATTIEGYKIGDFEGIKQENEDGTTSYKYNHDELACYECINGSTNSDKSIYEYVRASATDKNIKKSYFTALARERYNTIKLSDNLAEVTMSPEQAAKILSGQNKTYDEVIEMFNYIYNKYTYNDDSKTIFVSFDGISWYHLTLKDGWYKNAVNNLTLNERYTIEYKLTNNNNIVLMIQKTD